MYKLTIYRESNGYILEGNDSQTEEPMKSLIEDQEDDLVAHETLLWEIMEYFCFGGSKHDKERLRIVREKGENWNEKRTAGETL